MRENEYQGFTLPSVVRYNLKSSHSAKPVTADLTNNVSYIMCVHVYEIWQIYLPSSKRSLLTCIEPKVKAICVKII